MSSVKKEKQKCRKLILSQRNSLEPRIHSAWSRAILERFKASPFYQNARRLGLYASFGSEVNTWPLIGQALLEGKIVALPRTYPKKKELVFHRVFCLSELVPGPYGLLEPPERNPQLGPEELDLIVVPGLAFDYQGHRLGYGGGFYDRLLGASRLLKVALAFSFQVLPEIPHQEHDLRVDLIFTEKEVLRTNSGPDLPGGPAPSVPPRR